MKYITIARNEDYPRAKTKVKIELDKPMHNYYASSAPQQYMGNKKVLALREKHKFEGIVYKIEGPGFIIDKLYQEEFG